MLFLWFFLWEEHLWKIIFKEIIVVSRLVSFYKLPMFFEKFNTFFNLQDMNNPLLVVKAKNAANQSKFLIAEKTFTV